MRWSERERLRSKKIKVIPVVFENNMDSASASESA